MSQTEYKYARKVAIPQYILLLTLEVCTFFPTRSQVQKYSFKFAFTVHKRRNALSGITNMPTFVDFLG